MSLLYAIDTRKTVDARQAAVEPVGFGELFSAQFDNTKKNHWTISSDIVYGQAATEQAEQYRELTGQDLDEVLTPALVQKRIAMNRDLMRDEKHQIRREKLAELGVEVDDLDVIAERIVAASDKRLMEATARARRGTNVRTAQVLGSLGSAVLDPLNLATMFYGAGAGRTVLQTMAIEGVIGAGTELASAPAISAWQKQLGKEYGFDEIMTGMLFGGLGGAAFGGAFRGASHAINKLKNAREGLMREALADVEREVLLLEYKPEGISREEHIQNQKIFDERVLDLESRRSQAHQAVQNRIVEGDITGDLPPLNKLTAAVRLAQIDSTPGAVPMASITRNVDQELIQQASATVKNLEGKTLTKAEKAEIKKKLDRAEQAAEKSDLWWEQQAARSIQARDKTNFLETASEKKFQAAIKKEATRLRAINQERIRKGTEALDNDSIARRSKLELTSLKKGKVPKRLQQVRQERISDLAHLATLRQKHGVEGMKRIDDLYDADLKRLNADRPQPIRKFDEVVESVEAKEAPDYDGALFADMKRIQDSESAEMDLIWDDEVGDFVDPYEYLDEIDKRDAGIEESITTCVT